MKNSLIGCLVFVGLFGLFACNTYYYDDHGWHHDHDHHHHDWDDGHHHGWGHVDMDSSDSVVMLANDYGLNGRAAKDIIDFAAKKDKGQALADMGVTAREMAALSKLEMPSEGTIQKIASHLNEDPAKIETVLSDFISDIQTENESLNH